MDTMTVFRHVNGMAIEVWFGRDAATGAWDYTVTRVVVKPRGMPDRKLLASGRTLDIFAELPRLLGEGRECSHLTCMECGSSDIAEDIARWAVQSLEPTDRGNEGELIEHQCRDCGRSFWLGSDTCRKGDADLGVGRSPLDGKYAHTL